MKKKKNIRISKKANISRGDWPGDVQATGTKSEQGKKNEKCNKGEKSLWVAVITQAVSDAVSNSLKPEARSQKQKALQWLAGDSLDFITVCENAGFEPDYVRRKVKKALANGIRWRAEPGQGKRSRLRPKATASAERRKHQKSDQDSQGSLPFKSAHILFGPWS